MPHTLKAAKTGLYQTDEELNSKCCGPQIRELCRGELARVWLRELGITLLAPSTDVDLVYGQGSLRVQQIGSEGMGGLSLTLATPLSRLALSLLFDLSCLPLHTSTRKVATENSSISSADFSLWGNSVTVQNGITQFKPCVNVT